MRMTMPSPDGRGAPWDEGGAGTPASAYVLQNARAPLVPTPSPEVKSARQTSTSLQTERSRSCCEEPAEGDDRPSGVAVARAVNPVSPRTAKAVCRVSPAGTVSRALSHAGPVGPGDTETATSMLALPTLPTSMTKTFASAAPVAAVTARRAMAAARNTATTARDAA
jgi:hypothetical protein